MKTVLQYLRPQYARLALQLTIKFIGTITELFLPWMLSHILDDVVPQKDMPQVYLWGIFMLLAATVALLGNVIANRMSTRISRRFTEKLRHDAFARVSYLSSRQIDGFTLSSLISRLTSDTYNVHQMVDRMQRLGVRAPILLLGGIIVTFTLEPVLTLVLVATLPLLGVVVFSVSRRGVPLYVRVQSAVDAMELAGRGMNAAQIKELLEQEKMQSSIYIMLDTLTYLKKGGRINTTTALAANLLNIKPVMKFGTGKLDVFQKCRGMKKSRKAMIDAMHRELETTFKKEYDAGKVYLMAASSSTAEVTADWISQIRESFPGMDVMCDDLSLGLSCHIGPDGLGIGCSCMPL